jgi:hypothetical protein
MRWLVDNPIAISVGLLLSVGALSLAREVYGAASEAAAEPTPSENEVRWLLRVRVLSFVLGLLGSLFFATRFVKWAWTF